MLSDIIVYGTSADPTIPRQVIYTGTLNEAEDAIWTVLDIPVEDWVYSIEIEVNNVKLKKAHIGLIE
jgi:hypothetical protein